MVNFVVLIKSVGVKGAMICQCQNNEVEMMANIFFASDSSTHKALISSSFLNQQFLFLL